jgi:cold shock protein
MTLSDIKRKITEAGYTIQREKSLPNKESILLILTTKDKIIVEIAGAYSVIGPNKDELNKLISTIDDSENLVDFVKYIANFAKKMSAYIASAAAGGVIGNRADNLLGDIFDDSEDKDESRLIKEPNPQADKSVKIDSFSKRKTGIVKFYNETKGFGFISPDDDSEDIFVLGDGLEENIIHERDHVEFEVFDGKKGKSAVKVRILIPASNERHNDNCLGEILLLNGISLQEISKESGISAATINRIVKHRNIWIRQATMEKLTSSINNIIVVQIDGWHRYVPSDIFTIKTP